MVTWLYLWFLKGFLNVLRNRTKLFSLGSTLLLVTGAFLHYFFWKPRKSSVLGILNECYKTSCPIRSSCIQWIKTHVHFSVWKCKKQSLFSCMFYSFRWVGFLSLWIIPCYFPSSRFNNCSWSSCLVIFFIWYLSVLLQPYLMVLFQFLQGISGD